MEVPPPPLAGLRVSPAITSTSSFDNLSIHLILNMRRHIHISNASSLLQLSFLRVHVSQPYKVTLHTRLFTRRFLREILMLVLSSYIMELQKHSSMVIYALYMCMHHSDVVNVSMYARGCWWVNPSENSISSPAHMAHIPFHPSGNRCFITVRKFVRERIGERSLFDSCIIIAWSAMRKQHWFIVCKSDFPYFWN